ncbi:MacB family efflux pump subunit [Acidovorax cavernicola]|uniref:Pyoverdine export ATP-binding/permease protein PvdT n=1 Tax=Acidovorax cavernicola TaxID=1675792 RepID=A0A9X8GT84_9BURK|nr:MacB family efflux pump subunit [Acidovorax cavernicola]
MHDLRKSYGGHDGAPAVEVLRGITLELHAGEFVAIVGSSGSGKSTLMNLLGCLDRPSGGRYLFAGQDVAGMDADALARLRREAFGFVFQGYHLISTESAQENVEMPAIYAGVSPTDRESRARGLLTRLGLGERLGHRPHQLSGGQQQRVSIARALMNGGRIVLADEPTGALDSRSGEEVMALLDEMAAAGHTVILITHDREVARRARRVIEIRDGCIVSDSGRAPAEAPPEPAPSPLPSPSTTTDAADTPRALLSELHEALRAAWRVMWVHRFRTGLTLLGIVIGVASVIVMLAVGTGSQEAVMKQISLFGADKMYVAAIPDSARGRGGKLTLADVDTIRRLPNVRVAMPYIEGFVIARRGNVDHRTEGGGATTDFEQALKWPTARGIFFDENDEQSLAKVAVIGERVQAALFADGTDPVGQRILLDNVPFDVLGVLAAKGAGGGQASEDERVIVPFSTAAARLYGSNYPTWVAVAVHDVDKASETAAEIVEALAAQRHVRDVQVFNQTESIKARAQTQRTMTLMLGLIAAVSLLVGGIGVMNVMLMTVRERTREIGIRMATGARQRDILRQFLVEAVLVTVTGGVAGVVIGLLVGAALIVWNVPVIFSLTAIVGAFCCAVLTGLVFGFMPARKAAALDPVAALSSE